MDPLDRRIAALGRAVRRRRLKLGLSQRQAAAQWGLERTFLSRLERGLGNPNLQQLMTLAQGLEVSLTELFREAEAEDEAE